MSTLYCDRGAEFLDVHLDRAVARYHHDLAVRRGEFRADSGRQPVAHRAEPARGQQRARPLERKHLRHPHLMLADVGRDDAVALGQVVHLLDHVQRRNRVALLAALLLVERLFLLPLQDLLMPFGPQRRALGRYPRATSPPSACRPARSDIADDRDVDLDVFRNRRRIDIDVDDGLGLGREIGDAARSRDRRSARPPRPGNRCCTTAVLVPYEPCIPSIPRHNGSEAGNDPSPISVSHNGMPSPRISWANSAAAPDHCTPPPT